MCQQHQVIRAIHTVALAAVLAACATAPQPSAGPGGAGTGVVEVRAAGGEVVPAAAAIVARSDAEILGLLHESNLAEIDAGTMAEQRALDPAVKAFARHMVEEHRTLDQRGSERAAQLGITPTLGDSALPRRQQGAMTALRRAVDTDVDRLYLDQQVNAHRRTLALIDAALVGAQREELKLMLMEDVRPRVVEHLQRAQDLRRRRTGAP